MLGPALGALLVHRQTRGEDYGDEDSEVTGWNDEE